MEWIKMRGALLEHPKVVAIARKLRENPAFAQWLFGPAEPPELVHAAPSGAGVELGGPSFTLGHTRFSPAPAQEVTVSLRGVTNAALRYVTVGALLRLWSSARDHGHFVGDDLVLEHSTTADLDDMAGLPGLAAAMKEVGWLTNGKGITLPNFKEFNVPQSGAERQAEYRKRHGIEDGRGRDESRNEKVTKRASHRVTRVEKSREEVFAPSLTGSRPGSEGAVASSVKDKSTVVAARATDEKTPLQLSCGETWRRYCAAYETRWGATPARSATANAHVKAFCQRVPLAEAPEIAEFFCSHKRGLYVAAHHDLALLHRDAAGLRTEWLTMRPQMDHEARAGDRTATTGNAFATLIAEAEARERKAHA